MTEHNLASYFVLPLLELYPNSFKKDTYINTLITKDNRVVVHVTDLDQIDINAHVNYLFDLTYEENNYIIYEIPPMFKDDLKKFKIGRYRHYSEMAIDKIKKYSGLQYNIKQQGRYVTDKRILALLGSDILRTHLEHSLEVTISKEADLLDPPNETNFINL